MSIRETSGYESTNELRSQIGLQFFAEGGDGGDTGADMDGDFGTDFEAGLLGDGLENQQTAGQNLGEGGADGLENQQPEGQQEQPEDKQEGGQEPPAEVQQEQPPQLVPMTFNGQQIMLPQEAVQQLRGALGTDPVALLQKGMNYDHKAERELRLLDQYASAAGQTRAQFLEQLEQAQRQAELAAEVDKARSEFPEGTPDAALTEIAKSRVASKRAAEQQQRAQQQAAVQQVQQRANQAVQEARRKAEIAEWDRYEQMAKVHKPEDIPPRVMELVQQQGLKPTEAHLQYQLEQAQQQNEINKKDQQNRRQSAGSLAGADNLGGFEAEFMKAFQF